MAIDFNPMTDIDCDDPFSLYRRLRDEAPVHWSAEADMFCVSRYSDVLNMLRDDELFSSSGTLTVLLRNVEVPINFQYGLKLLRFLLKTRISPFKIARTGNLITMDRPRHDVLRKIVGRGFTPRRIADWEPRIRELVDEQLVDLHNGERFDVVSDFATPLPTTIIAEMLGIEPSRRDDFKRWSRSIIEIASGLSDIRNSDVMEHLGELFAYLQRIIRARREQPRDDLISVLVDPRQEGVLDDELEVIQFVVLLLVAGNETTTNLIGNAVHALIDRPDQIELLIREPERIDNLVEEAVRFDAPLQFLFRSATRDTEIAGVKIPKGSIVAAMVSSANRDERRFEDPDRFDMTRDTSGHLGFGFGIHFCLGAALARLESRVALGALLPQLQGFVRVEKQPKRLETFLLRGRARLELEAA